MDNYYGQKAVIYARLSNDDKTDESESISNQREILYAYCASNGILVLKEFIDDGWTGGNFDRPAFKELLKYIENNPVDLVITKDLSRLGRDMTESSMYAERYFTEHGIRFIAIHDNFDSFNENIYAPFQFAMNDVYIRDASRKIKAVLAQKKKVGKYCSCPPFGYKKMTGTKDKLVPDENTAPTVRTIFNLCAEGKSLTYVTQYLNASGYMPPLKYRVTCRDQFSPEGAARASDEWNRITIKRIVKNRVYLGHTLQAKTKKISPKSKKKVAIPENDWLVVENTHEPLVTQNVFDAANHTVDINYNSYKNMVESRGGLRKSIFQGLVFCENCGGKLNTGGTVYRGEHLSYWYLNCANIPSRSKNKCEHGARIRYHALVEIVLQELNKFIDLSGDEIDAIIESLKKSFSSNEHNERIKKQKEQIEKEIAETDKIIENLYRDNVSGKISDDRFYSIIDSLEKRTAEHKKAMVLLEEQIIKTNPLEDYEKFFDIVKSYTHLEKLDEDIVNAFIERIEVGESSVKRAKKKTTTQTVKIYYKFIGDCLNSSSELSRDNGIYKINPQV